MRKFNAKNLRREVQKQLKELRGGVSEQASLATKTMTMTKTFDEEKIFNSHLSSLNSTEKVVVCDEG